MHLCPQRMQLESLRTHGINCVGQVVMNPEGVLLVSRVSPRTSFLSKGSILIVAYICIWHLTMLSTGMYHLQ